MYLNILEGLVISDQCNSQQKMWPRRDFIWLCIVLVIILIAISAYLSGGSTRANENLNFAATAVGIVLAVVAIVITLVDVAGQKHNIMQLRETTDDLQRSLIEVKSLVASTAEALVLLNETTDEYKLAVNENRDLSNNIISSIQELANDVKKGSNGLVENQNQDLMYKLLENVKETQSNINSKYHRFRFQIKVVDPGGFFDLIDFKNFLQNKLEITNSNKLFIGQIAKYNYILRFTLEKKLTRLEFSEILGDYPIEINMV